MSSCLENLCSYKYGNYSYTCTIIYYLTGSDFGLTGDGYRMISAAFYRNREDVCVCVCEGLKDKEHTGIRPLSNKFNMPC